MSCAKTYFKKMENSLIRNFHFFAWHMAATFNDFPGETYIIGGYPILQCRKKNWQIPKYRVENRRNTETVFMIGHAYVKLCLFRMFVYQACIHHSVNSAIARKRKITNLSWLQRSRSLIIVCNNNFIVD